MGVGTQGPDAQVTFKEGCDVVPLHLQSSLWLLWGKSSVRGRNGGSREDSGGSQTGFC